MALTPVNVPANTSVQVDDGSHATVYIANQGQNECVVLPSGDLLSPSESVIVNVTVGVPVMVESAKGTTVAFEAKGNTPGSPGIPVIDGGAAV